MRTWRARYGAAPSSYDWSRTHARQRGGEALKRLQAGEWPAASTVIDLYPYLLAQRITTVPVKPGDEISVVVQFVQAFGDVIATHRHRPGRITSEHYCW